ncbi:MAG: cytochrome d ubiquinol oxidase subunit II [Methylacidiphilales bacterium]|nr:cytochrome d ubiquinol oxidase subunit II [Candidatus Methylacidiphilales bacterium]
MIELWYIIMSFMLIVYVVFDGRNFGAGVLHLFVARTPAERRQVIAAIGPLWSWHEVWLLSFGGTLFVAFPRLYAASFSGYYLALFLILWCYVLRGISLEVGGHLNDRMWQGFWDVVFAFANILLAILFGVALGDLARGAPIGPSGEFSMAFFTDFRVRGAVGLLDWYTVFMGVVCLLMLMAHGATYLAHKTDGPVHDRCLTIARRLWIIMPVIFVIISAATWYVRPELAGQLAGNPFAWLAILFTLAGVVAVFAGLRGGQEGRAVMGSGMIIAGLLATGAATIFPVILYSTLDPVNSLTAYNTAASQSSLELAIIWWPFALALTCVYFWFIARLYTGKVKEAEDTQGYS